MGKFQNKNYLLTLRTKFRKRMVSTLLGVKDLKNTNDQLIKASEEEPQTNIQYKEEPEEIDLEKLILEKANRVKNTENEPSMTLVHDTHLLSFQQTTDLFTLMYTSIIFKWIKSEKVSNY